MQLTPLLLFKNLSDSTRLTIVLLLKAHAELCVCQLCEVLALPQSKISRHLAMLRECGILVDRRDGKWVHYRLSNHIPVWANTIISETYLSQEQAISLLYNKIVSVKKSIDSKSSCI